MLPEPPRCAFPGCSEWGDHQHHITYNPEVIKWLCFGHHEQITILNGQQARKYRVPLSNKFRWRIWYAWIRGEVKIRRTHKSLEWTREWQGRPAEQIEEPRASELPVKAEPKSPKKKLRRQRKKAKKQRKPNARARNKRRTRT